jgi:hypothetical protein
MAIVLSCCCIFNFFFIQQFIQKSNEGLRSISPRLVSFLACKNTHDYFSVTDHHCVKNGARERDISFNDDRKSTIVQYAECRVLKYSRRQIKIQLTGHSTPWKINC